jgi:hypothetical protein
MHINVSKHSFDTCRFAFRVISEAVRFYPVQMETVMLRKPLELRLLYRGAFFRGR